MKAWHQLEVAALLGTSKASPVSDWPIALQPLVQSTTQTTEQALLSQLALMSVWLRAGWQPATMAVPASLSTETQPMISPAARSALFRCLDKDGQYLLPEWLQLAAAGGWRVTPASLPTLLRLGEGQRDLRLWIGAVVGQRGIWLAQQNPDWQWLMGAVVPLTPNDIQECWQTASLPVRELIFQRLRQAQPAQARTWLQQIWSEEPAANRKVFVDYCLQGLTQDDEPWLESLLDDRSQLVRESAIQLLMRLSHSSRQQRLQAIVPTVLHVKRGLVKKSLEVQPLTSVEAALARDGLDPKAKSQQGLGEKSQWLRDIVAGAGVEALLQLGDWDSEALVHACLKTDWAEALLQGLAVAAITRQHCVMLHVLLAVDDKRLQLDQRALLAALPVAEREQQLANSLVAGKKAGEGLALTVQLLAHLPTWFWSADFSLKLLTTWQGLQGKEKLSYEFESRIFPQTQQLLARYGAPELGQMVNHYPVELRAAWALRLAMRQSLAVP